ncbi:MAG: hypothetical protein IPL75_14475 [Acidobacteria bacterium]|nr:hypothetical protein [Acidobacteriota bacterium]
MSVVRRYRVGRDLMPVELTEELGHLEGRSRLAPGEIVELLDVPSARGVEPRRALVESWSVWTMGHGGTVYRGTCRWIESSG